MFLRYPIPGDCEAVKQPLFVPVEVFECKPIFTLPTLPPNHWPESTRLFPFLMYMSVFYKHRGYYIWITYGLTRIVMLVFVAGVAVLTLTPCRAVARSPENVASVYRYIGRKPSGAIDEESPSGLAKKLKSTFAPSLFVPPPFEPNLQELVVSEVRCSPPAFGDNQMCGIYWLQQVMGTAGKYHSLEELQRSRPPPLVPFYFIPTSER